MAIGSPGFIALFAGVFAVFWLCPARRRWAAVLAANLIFYSCGSTPTLWWCLGASILFSWGVGLALGRATRLWQQRLLLGVGLAGLLGFLAAFKYLGFFSGGRWALGLAQPVGISFYTLQTAGYLLDVRHGTLVPEKHLGRYAAYVSFFATLTSGPIECAADFLPQLQPEGLHPFDAAQARRGLVGFLFGLFQKFALANYIGSFLTGILAAQEKYIGNSLLFACILYSLYIYFDFAGYSNMALGLGRMLGFELTQNFRQPYFAGTLREFWTRWHISLSHWLRDHVYFALGGSRRGMLLACVNLMLTFLVSGLWHGAGLCFLAWGALHGLYQAAGRLTLPLRRRFWAALHISERNPLLRLWRVGFTFALVTLAWLFFSLGTSGGSVADGILILRRIAAEVSLRPQAIKNGIAMLNLARVDVSRMGIALLLAFLPDWFGRNTSPEDWLLALPAPARTLLCWAMVAAVFFIGTAATSFIYNAF